MLNMLLYAAHVQEIITNYFPRWHGLKMHEENGFVYKGQFVPSVCNLICDSHSSLTYMTSNVTFVLLSAEVWGFSWSSNMGNSYSAEQ